MGKQTLKSEEERRKDLANELYHTMFDDIGGFGGFSQDTEYNMGVGRMAEEFHCIFGASMKEILSGFPEDGHISEEVEKLEGDIDEYSRDIPQYSVNDTDKVIDNAERVINYTNGIERKLDRLEELGADEWPLTMARLSNEGLQNLCMEVKNNPDSKPFRDMEPYAERMETELEERGYPWE